MPGWSIICCIAAGHTRSDLAARSGNYHLAKYLSKASRGSLPIPDRDSYPPLDDELERQLRQRMMAEGAAVGNVAQRLAAACKPGWEGRGSDGAKDMWNVPLFQLSACVCIVFSTGTVPMYLGEHGGGQAGKGVVE